MTNLNDVDWSKLPQPEDDGAASHLKGLELPPLGLRSTDGTMVDLSTLPGLSVVYVYPMTGQPGTPLPNGWDDIPGARGCTPQSCAFRDHNAELRTLGATYLFGLSTQSTDYQAEAAARMHLPFALLSDADLAFAKALKLPTFQVDSMELLKRLTLIIQNGKIIKYFYPVFPPDRSAADVITWLQSR